MNRKEFIQLFGRGAASLLASLALHIPENGRQPTLHPARHWHAPGRGRHMYWAFWLA